MKENMKRLAMTLLAATLLAGCSGVSQEDYDALAQERNAIQSELADATILLEYKDVQLSEVLEENQYLAEEVNGLTRLQNAQEMHVGTSNIDACRQVTALAEAMNQDILRAVYLLQVSNLAISSSGDAAYAGQQGTVGTKDTIMNDNSQYINDRALGGLPEGWVALFEACAPSGDSV